MKTLQIFALLLFLLPVCVFAQGSTNAAIKGKVLDENGEPLPGATVIATHVPTNTDYGTSTNTTGTFNLRNLRIGGPYRVRISFVGFETYAQEKINLSIGETFTIEANLKEGSTDLETLQVTAERDTDKNKSGVGTNIDEATIDDQPNVGRSLADYLRLTPQAYVVSSDDDGPAISIAGQNNRFNSIYVDGVVNNDVFGLSAQGTNGGQTGATPISIDAVEQFQVNASPFDVTQGGFTGGSINLTTKSGTNTFKGSYYYFNRNEGFTGDTPIKIENFEQQTNPDFKRQDAPEFSNNRYGIRLSGPIIEDKLFFFVNGEILRSDTPVPFSNNFSGNSSLAEIQEIRTLLQNELGFDPGSFRDKVAELNSDKILAKINWNINANHRLMARYNRVQSDNVDAFASDANEINFTGRNEVFPNTTHSGVIEINSNFNNTLSNNFTFSVTDVNDDRGVNGPLFPTVNIFDGDGDIQLGNEPFSTSNKLEQRIYTLTNDFDIFLGNHTITVGTHNEYYDILNQFIPFNTGWYFYDSLNDFKQSIRAVNDPSIDPAAPAILLRGVSLVGGQNVVGDAAKNPGAFNAFQLGFYGQDKWQATDDLKLTFGIRFDIPSITDDPRFPPDVFETTIPAIQEFRDLKGARPGESPDAQLYFSPRVGFNWNVGEKDRTQIRGGFGKFLGRVPFVWPGGMFVNNGANTGQINAGFFNGISTLANGEPIPFRPDPENGLTLEDFGRTPDQVIPSGRLEIFSDNFKYPQVFRSSIGVDQNLPYGINATIEMQYTKRLNQISVENVNLKPANETLDGPDNRPIFAYTDENGNFDPQENFIDGRFTNIHVVDNTEDGFAYDITAKLSKQYRDILNVNFSYTFGESKGRNDGTSSQINSIWRFNENVNGANNLPFSRSDFSLGHRITSSITFKKEFFGNTATTISLFYTGQSGRPFSYIIDQSENMINENGADASLLFVPNSAFDFQWAGSPAEQEAQAAALDRFIRSSDHLNRRRGTYAQRNAQRAPFSSVVDLKFRQELFGNVFNLNQKVSISFDIFNFTALLGDLFDTEWGTRYDVPSSVNVVEFEEFVDPDNGDFTPVYSLDLPSNVQTESDLFRNNVQDLEGASTFGSRWFMQLGARYEF